VSDTTQRACNYFSYTFSQIIISVMSVLVLHSFHHMISDSATLTPMLFAADDSVIALADRCPHLRSLGLYFCKNITDRAMYSLAQSKVNNKMWGSVNGGNDEDGLRTLNISQCTSLTPSAVQAVCDSSPALHTCSGRHSLIISGCLNLTSVHCACCVRPHNAISPFPHSAH
jgi:F-box and leucine-rich repeat protein 1 (S-phase kinase-associated protein 2)